MERSIYLFQNSFLNINIESEDFMVSSFPNKLVIGEPFLDGYKKSKSFYFCVHEIKDFFIALSKCIMYVTFEKPENCGTVIERGTSEIYHWEGFEIIHSTVESTDQIERKFKFLKKNSETDVFEIIFSLHQTEILISIVNELVLNSMCIKFSDRKIIDFLITKKVAFEEKEAVFTLIQQQGFTENISPIVDLLYYYREIFQVLKETNELKNKLLYPQFFIDEIQSEIQQNMARAEN